MYMSGANIGTVSGHAAGVGVFTSPAPSFVELSIDEMYGNLATQLSNWPIGPAT